MISKISFPFVKGDVVPFLRRVVSTFDHLCMPKSPRVGRITQINKQEKDTSLHRHYLR